MRQFKLIIGVVNITTGKDTVTIWTSEQGTSLVFAWKICVRLSNGPVSKWWSETWTEKSLFIVQNVLYFNGQPSHMTLAFEYQTPKLSGIHMNLVLRCFGIHMVTVDVVGKSYTRGRIRCSITLLAFEPWLPPPPVRALLLLGSVLVPGPFSTSTRRLSKTFSLFSMPNINVLCHK